MKLKCPYKETNEAAINDPKIGDLWMEHFAFYCYVCDVKDGDVYTLKASAPCEFPGDGKLEVRTLDEFKKWLSYNSIPGTWVDCIGRECDVEGWMDEKVAERIKGVDVDFQVSKQSAINYWSSDEITEEDANCFVSQIKEHGFHISVPIDAQAAMRSWAECEPSEENGKYLKAFAEIARLALGIE